MDLLQLRYFQAVARREHLSQAAAELRVAQPSLSRAIARLEADLGVPLFDRVGRGLRLNRFGARFLRRVDRVLRELDDARRELADSAGLDRGSVAVAAETLLTLTGLLTEFRAGHPGVNTRLYQSSAATMAEQLRIGEVDLCFASQPLSGPDLRTLELLREEVLLAVPPGHRLAGRERVRLEELADERFVTTRPGYWPRELCDRLFAEAGLRPQYTCESDEPGATGDLIGAGLGVGLVPEFSRRTITHAPAAWLRLDVPDCHRSLTLVWRKDTYLSAAARRLTDFARDYFRSL
ncbi:DNA-binding transcriptional LysR family regulator [Saccharothrix tamanrassetensis]|uniref:DNA-binding transcriptional LysR family regulator n=1 Tax=Saccharothrix tamanrassetensis TaxID=1051531 RepID=A0A841CMZ9_9PSEU|nr:LysR family transcriptional regulator [Saccharothrix tamanrassetensis]MBB5958500.1 DNA-binding transcriptional LysR family regulator [Saccharothrix tamanrassetensis]